MSKLKRFWVNEALGTTDPYSGTVEFEFRLFVKNPNSNFTVDSTIAEKYKRLKLLDFRKNEGHP